MRFFLRPFFSHFFSQRNEIPSIYRYQFIFIILRLMQRSVPFSQKWEFSSVPFSHKGPSLFLKNEIFPPSLFLIYLKQIKIMSISLKKLLRLMQRSVPFSQKWEFSSVPFSHFYRPISRCICVKLVDNLTFFQFLL